MSEWRPIETAPRDGSVILIAGGHDDQLDCTDDVGMQAFMRSPARAMWRGDSWVVAFAEACYVAVGREAPTHWMPLPAWGE